MSYIVQNQYGVITATEENNPRNIRFITPEYKTLFTISDGECVLFRRKGTDHVREIRCKYLDDYHLLFDGRAYHICELAEYFHRIGAYVVPFPQKRIVWSDIDLRLEDWITDLAEEHPGLGRDKYEYMMYEINNGYLDDEKVNLNIPVGGDILVIADLGLWNGRHSGYRVIQNATLANCLDYRCDSAEWYVTRNGEFMSRQIHHDGTNYYTYRKWKIGISDESKWSLLDHIYNGTATRTEIDRATDRLGFDVAKVYGWEFPSEISEKQTEHREER